MVVFGVGYRIEVGGMIGSLPKRVRKLLKEMVMEYFVLALRPGDAESIANKGVCLPGIGVSRRRR